MALESDFFAIGTNDLVQYLLATDRTNESVAALYDALHPAVLRTLQIAVNAAHVSGIPVSVCGEIAGDTELTAVLLGLGFSQLSMNASSIPRVKQVIRSLNRVDCEDLVAQIMRCDDPGVIRQKVDAFNATRGS
jgi:phosphoenolpyruvate-protein kinase (PTS system EI component)